MHAEEKNEKKARSQAIRKTRTADGERRSGPIRSALPISRRARNAYGVIFGDWPSGQRGERGERQGQGPPIRGKPPPLQGSSQRRSSGELAAILHGPPKRPGMPEGDFHDHAIGRSEADKRANVKQAGFHYLAHEFLISGQIRAMLIHQSHKTTSQPIHIAPFEPEPKRAAEQPKHQAKKPKHNHNQSSSISQSHSPSVSAIRSSTQRLASSLVSNSPRTSTPS